MQKLSEFIHSGNRYRAKSVDLITYFEVVIIFDNHSLKIYLAL